MAENLKNVASPTKRCVSRTGTVKRQRSMPQIQRNVWTENAPKVAVAGSPTVCSQLGRPPTMKVQL